MVTLIFYFFVAFITYDLAFLLSAGEWNPLERFGFAWLALLALFADIFLAAILALHLNGKRK